MARVSPDLLLLLLGATLAACGPDSLPTETSLPPLGATAQLYNAASVTATGFEPSAFAIGALTTPGQGGWSMFSSGCEAYDIAIAANPGVAGFGSQSLRFSNAVTSGCFSDWLFSAPVTNEAGESSAVSDGLSGGTRQRFFEAVFDIASTVPGAEQPQLAMTISPDRGDGARMSYLRFSDTPAGLSLLFYDYQVPVADFVGTEVASGISRSVPHHVKITMEFVDGAQNDIVKVYLDGALIHTGTSWEDYFRNVENNPTRPVDQLLFRQGGDPAPATAGKGFLIDNVVISTGPVPPGEATSAQQCKNNGWRNLLRANETPFRNQGDCIQYVNTGR